MRRVFTIWGILSFIVGLMLLAVAKSAVHEIEAGLAFLIATVSFVGVAITSIRTIS